MYLVINGQSKCFESELNSFIMLVLHATFLLNLWGTSDLKTLEKRTKQTKGIWHFECCYKLLSRLFAKKIALVRCYNLNLKLRCRIVKIKCIISRHYLSYLFNFKYSISSHWRLIISNPYNTPYYYFLLLIINYRNLLI